MSMNRLLRLIHRDERGVVLPLAALMMAVLLGLVGLAIDVGQLTTSKRKAQNAADAGVHAGIAFLPASPDTADDNARLRAVCNLLSTANQASCGATRTPPPTETVSVTISRTDRDNDTIQVTVTRDVNYLFARALGLTNGTVRATARARLFVAQGVDTEANGIFPYAVWGGNQGGPAAVQAGDRVTYRSNSYRMADVEPIPGHRCPPVNNCN